MNFFDAILYWLLAVAVAAQQAPQSTPITACGLTCISQRLPASGCSLADTACQCSNKELAQGLGACMLANCTMQDTLILSKFEAGLCKFPNQNRGPLVVIVFILIATITSLLVALRLIAKGLHGQAFGPEDFVVAVALILVLPSAVLTIKMSTVTFGRHLYQLKDGDLLAFLRHFYIAENIYVVDLALSKLSILAFYLRVFQGYFYFRVAVFVTIALVAGSTATLSVLTIFQCQPLAYSWNKDLHGTCLDINALAYANAAMSIFQDLIIVTLPIPVVLRLNMAKGKKLSVAFMFVLGSFGFVVSIIRLQSLLVLRNSIDPSWDYVSVVIWTALELGVAMICSCLPALRTLFLYVYLKKFFSSILLSKSRSSFSDSAFGGKKNFMLLGDEDTQMTNITLNGDVYEYPRKPPALPSKNEVTIKDIEIGKDGKFR